MDLNLGLNQSQFIFWTCRIARHQQSLLKLLQGIPRGGTAGEQGT